MKLINKRTLLAPVLAFGVAVLAAGCQEKGPAGKAGEKIDNAADKVKDKLDTRGPGEKLGDKIDGK